MFLCYERIGLLSKARQIEILFLSYHIYVYIFIKGISLKNNSTILKKKKKNNSTNKFYSISRLARGAQLLIKKIYMAERGYIIFHL